MRAPVDLSHLARAGAAVYQLPADSFSAVARIVAALIAGKYSAWCSRHFKDF
jgi:hypothetical protein